MLTSAEENWQSQSILDFWLVFLIALRCIALRTSP